MPVKPGDLLLSVIEFFGILIPGTALVLLLWFDLQLFVDQLLLGQLFELSLDDSLKVNQIARRLEEAGWVGWVVGFFASYILGHFLLGAGEILQLDKKAMCNSLSRTKTTKNRYHEVRNHVILYDRMPKEIQMPENLRDFAYFTFHFIRIKNSDAIADIERNAADYKLFRSLMLVFFLDILFLIPLSDFLSLPDEIVWLHFFVALAGLVLSAIRFWQALTWTYRLGFEFYLLLHECRFPPSTEDSGGRETQQEESSPVPS